MAPLALIVALLSVPFASADEPPPTLQWQANAALIARQAVGTDGGIGAVAAWREQSAALDDAFASGLEGPRDCKDVPPVEAGESVSLVYTDADLIAGGDGTSLCIFFDPRWDSYSAWTLSATSIEEFRSAKVQLQPLLGRVGVEPCQVAFWSAFDRELRRQISLKDRYDGGRTCAPRYYDHGALSQFRRAEIEESIAAAATKAEEVFGWKLSWPLRVHAYDTEEDFAVGLTREGPFRGVSTAAVRGVGGTTMILANGGFGYLLNVRRFEDASELRMLISHEYAHVAQAGLIGTKDDLPFFAVEGGAEYFASLVVGPDQKNLAGRFQDAVADERSNRAVPLRELIEEPEARDGRRFLAAYSRGYAAMRFLTARWGADAYGHLHRENVDGNPERFLEAMRRLTGLTLDEFDEQLRAHLLGQATAMRSVGRATLVENSLLTSLITVRRTAGGAIEETERFGRSDSTVYVLFEFACLSKRIQGEVRFLTPAGERFAGAAGANGPGCDEAVAVPLRLDGIVNNRSPRTQPGTWTVEVYADDVLQGSITFIVE